VRLRKQAASATLALSVLLHLAVFWYFAERFPTLSERAEQAPATSVEILLKAPTPAPVVAAQVPIEQSEPEEPSPEEQTAHAPRDDGEQPAQTSAAPAPAEAEPLLLPDPEPTSPVASTASAPLAPAEPSPSEQTSPEPSPAPAAKTPPAELAALGASPAPALQAEGLPELQEAMAEQLQDSSEPIDDATVIEQMSAAFNGRLVPLDDQTLADASLVSNAEGSSRNARIADEGFMVNLYLRRMTEQVYASWKDWYEWEQKHSRRRAITGTISFQVSVTGRLESARVSRSSGDSDFDQSALQALKNVDRFAVPEDPAVTARYYRRLRFHFSTESREIGAILKAGASAG
tara:strand:+ start:86269 stop:87309 length:1041 start_codon:yes stop_codon:yes gene_type:complete